MPRKQDKNKFRTEFRKDHESRTRHKDLENEFQQGRLNEDQLQRTERVSGKGDLSRKRTVFGSKSDIGNAGFDVVLDVDLNTCRAGRVLSSHGLSSTVHGDDGQTYHCATRRLLKTLNTDQRHVVAAGDRILFRIERGNEGMIERIEPRHGVLCRDSKGRKQVIVANVDQLLIVASAAEPYLKPNLIDRFLVAAEQARITPVICINKVDLIDPAELQPLVGVYSQMGYEVLLLSALTGFGVERLQQLSRGKESAIAGQSGVGKSSLLNAIEPGLYLKVNEVSEENQKGKHTTTVAQLIPLAMGGFVVDTPGIRQFQLWDVIPAEVAGLFRDIRPIANHCRFPDCTHVHEALCAVKNAVADGHLDARRYESYCRLFAGEFAT